MNILSIDYDYFFRDKPESPSEAHLYDWGRRESPLFVHDLWEVRAAQFLANDLPLPGTTGQEKGFWQRFRIKKTATLFYAESHACMADPRFLRGGTMGSVWSYDAHHDMGYAQGAEAAMKKSGHVTCEDWLLFYSMLGWQTHLRYPSWRESDPEAESGCAPSTIAYGSDAAPYVVIDKVFLCRSGAWVPSWLDAAFFAFLDACPCTRRVRLGTWEVKPRGFPMQGAEEHADRLRKFYGKEVVAP